MIHFCVNEDRREYLVCLQVLLLSIRSKMPAANVHLFECESVCLLKPWLLEHDIKVTIHPQAHSIRGWGIKPFLLRQLLDEGLPRVTWLDADMIMLRGIDRIIETSPDSELLVTQEPGCSLENQAARALVWGDTPRRTFPSSLNSCVVKVSTQHRPLLDLWCDRIQQPLFQDAQKLPASTRPASLLSDQDILEGLLIGRFAETPCSFLKINTQIIQEFWMHDYPLRARLKNAFSPQSPYLLHGQGPKPWEVIPPLNKTPELRPYRQVSAYAAGCRKFTRHLDPRHKSWLSPDTPFARFSRIASVGNIHLEGCPLQFMDYSMDKLRVLKSVIRNRLLPTSFRK